MVLAEAQACGKPVLAGDSGGTRETMLVGRTGAIADCRSPESLAATLDELLSDTDRIAEMGHLGRAHVSATLDWPVHVEQAKRIFGSVKK
jgi:phosphatidylinositol alpha-1,6-mannosyltransferase